MGKVWIFLHAWAAQSSQGVFVSVGDFLNEKFRYWGWLIWALWHTTGSCESVPPDEPSEHVLAEDNTVEALKSLQSPHNSLKYPFKLVKTPSSGSRAAPQGWCHQNAIEGGVKFLISRWFFWAAAPSPLLSSDTGFVQNEVFEHSCCRDRVPQGHCHCYYLLWLLTLSLLGWSWHTEWHHGSPQSSLWCPHAVFYTIFTKLEGKF